MSNKPEEPAPAIWQDIEQAATPFLPQTAVDVEEAIQAYGDAERALYDFSDRDAIRKRDVARNELRAAIAAQPAPDATPAQPGREAIVDEQEIAAIDLWLSQMDEETEARIRARLAQPAPDAMPKRYTQDDLHADDNAAYRARHGDFVPRPLKPDAAPAQPVLTGSDGRWKASAQSGFAALRMIREAAVAETPLPEPIMTALKALRSAAYHSGTLAHIPGDGPDSAAEFRHATKVIAAAIAAQPAPDATPAQQEEWRLVLVKPHIDLRPGLLKAIDTLESAANAFDADGDMRTAHGLDVAVGRLRCLLAAQPAPDATPAQPVSAAGSKPVAWRCRHSQWGPSENRPWDYPTERPSDDYDYDIVEPLYATPTPALAAQGVVEAAHAVVDEYMRPNSLARSINAGTLKALRDALAAPSEHPDLPGLRLALEIIVKAKLGYERADIRAEIARIEGGKS